MERKVLPNFTMPLERLIKHFLKLGGENGENHPIIVQLPRGPRVVGVELKKGKNVADKAQPKSAMMKMVIANEDHDEGPVERYFDGVGAYMPNIAPDEGFVEMDDIVAAVQAPKPPPFPKPIGFELVRAKMQEPVVKDVLCPIPFKIRRT